MPSRLGLLFLVATVLDLALLVRIGGHLGVWPTLGLMAVTAAVGLRVVRREGVTAWRRVQARLATGAAPGAEVVDGLLVLVAGALLMAPGVLADAAGLVGLVLPARAVARRWLLRRWTRATAEGRVRVTNVSLGAPGVGHAPLGPFSPATPPPIEDAEVVDERRVDH